MLFAKRKRNIFKGPALSFNATRETRSTGSGPGSASHSRNASASGLGRRSGESAIQEVDEDAEEGDGEDEVEEVEVFSPIVQGPGETVEEIYEDGDETIRGPEDEGVPGNTKEGEGESKQPHWNCSPPRKSKLRPNVTCNEVSFLSYSLCGIQFSWQVFDEHVKKDSASGRC